jgi:malate dehydrogenase (oxaloacetate-decarboxylating)
MNPAKVWFAKATNREGFDGSISEAMQCDDLFLGVSGPRMITADQVRSMNPNSIVMALSNPEPEIMPELIHDVSQARIIATGRSDYPNQVNNVLCFPGLFRGAFDAAATKITEEMKIVAARAIAETIPNSQLSEDYILPSVFNPEVSESVAAAVAAEAIRSGVVRSKGSRVFI